MGQLLQLFDQARFSDLVKTFPCREQQIQTLATLLYPTAAPCQNLAIYGSEATGKSALTEAILRTLAEANSPTDEQQPAASSAPAQLQHAVINSVECITGRHLFERTVGEVASALQWQETARRCESMAQLTVELSKMLKYVDRPNNWRFVLVFDAIDRQREAPATLLPALARLAEIIPNLTTVFILTSPPASYFRTSYVPHVYFPNYTKAEFVRIISTTPPPALANTTAEETAELWKRFSGAVHDSLTKSAARTLPAFKEACSALWPRFTGPILDGTYSAREFSKLLIASRVHFQDESLLDPGVIALPPPPSKTCSSVPPSRGTSAPSTPSHRATADANTLATTPQKNPAAAAHKTPDLAALLPITARLLLMAAYLASHNAHKHDLTLFSTHYHGRKRRRGGFRAGGRQRTKHRRIARKLLGAHAFVMERMMAIFAAVRSEWVADGHLAQGGGAMDCDVGMAIATLSSLRLLVKVGVGGDPMDRGGKWRVNVGWEMVRGFGRSIGVEVEEWLID